MMMKARWWRLYTYAAACNRATYSAAAPAPSGSASHLLLQSACRGAHHRVHVESAVSGTVRPSAFRAGNGTRCGEVGCVQRQQAGKPQRRQDTQTHRRIREAASAAELYGIVQGAAAGDVNALVLTAAFHRLAILQVEKRRLARGGGASANRSPRLQEGGFMRKELRMLERMAASKVGEFDASHCALTLWSLAKLSALTKSIANISDDGGKNAYEAPPALLDALMLRARDTAASARPQNVANIIWACATLGLRPSPDLVDALSKRITVSAGAYASQAVSNILWAFASLRLEPSEELTQVLLQRATAVLAESSAQGVANTAWALGSLSIQPAPALLHELHARIVATSSQLTAQGVATSLWGHAALGLVPNRAALTALVKACMLHTPRMSPHELAITMWSLASFRKLASQNQHTAVSRTDSSSLFHASSPVVEALSWSAIDMAERFDAQSVSMVLWAIATLSRLPSPPPAALPAQLGQAVYAPGRDDPTRQPRQDKVGPAQALAAQHARDEVAANKPPRHPDTARRSLTTHGRGIRTKGAAGRLIFRLLARLPQCAREFSPQDLACCYWALASLGVNAGAARSALAEAARAHLPRLNSQDVSTILWALASLNDDPSLPCPAQSSRARSGKVGSEHQLGRGEGREVTRRVRPWADEMMGGGHGAAAKLRGARGNGTGESGRPPVEQRLSWALMMRAGDMAHTFTCQQVSNSLWAAASLGLVAALVPSRASVWYSTTAASGGREAGGSGGGAARPGSRDGLRHVIDQLALQLYVLADGHLEDTTFEHVHLCQLHQFFLSCDLVLSGSGGGGGDALLPGRMRRVYRALRTPARVCFEMQTVEPEISALQQQVADVLESMQLGARLEIVEARSGYKIDILLHVDASRDLHPKRHGSSAAPSYYWRHVQNPGALGKAGHGDGGGAGEFGGRVMPAGWLVEVDGPSHFLQGKFGGGEECLVVRSPAAMSCATFCVSVCLFVCVCVLM